MAETIGDIVEKVRSKNAGPFWVTLDIFCGTPEVFRRVGSALPTKLVASRFDTPARQIKRFEIEDLNVLKFSLPRPSVQGAWLDRDMHGAGWAVLLAEVEI
ncbi:MAG: DUF4387 family protein [Arenicellales bacterium]|jgi:hypothetical protein|nr:hypothetical protein [Acidiferrobacteraceae bacterium]MDP6122472.1 DUF4387 family protein [Arenicellales bacterium]MDP7522197.1 DUF4387 family protein [Arenicellales bacterium]|tara:strand:+ start:1117 stop:1419 length:303 start_codon:yes stop_codon:yes gene_type:complete